jgi:hypothetical protein
MRYFIISDEGGQPIYYDHKDGRLLSLVLVNTHIMMKENLGQRFKSMACGRTLFVFQKVLRPLPSSLHFPTLSVFLDFSIDPKLLCAQWLVNQPRSVARVQYEKLSYLVVSDQGESEMFLRSLLRQVTNCLCLSASALLLLPPRQHTRSARMLALA